MRFVHTADWQIGIKAVGLGEQAARRVREERFAAAQRVIDVARKHSVDFIIVAGDMFENNAIARGDVQRASDLLSSFGRPVYILPGNHDALGPGSVWQHPCWAANPNLIVLRDSEPVLAAGAWLYPCPLSVDETEREAFSTVAPEATGIPRVGIAHGSVGMEALDPGALAIPQDIWRSKGLDYVALGHWHSRLEFPDAEGVVHMAYSGAPEPTAIGERDSGQVLVVDLPRQGGLPVVRSEPTAGLRWQDISKDLRTIDDLRRVFDELDRVEDGKNTIARVRLSGFVTAEGQPLLDHLKDILETRFLSGRLDTSELRPLVNDAWLAELPPGIVRQVTLRLRDQAEYDPVAARAMLELRAIVQGMSS